MDSARPEAACQGAFCEFSLTSAVPWSGIKLVALPCAADVHYVGLELSVLCGFPV
jgi:hypothetical protein